MRMIINLGFFGSWGLGVFLKLILFFVVVKSCQLGSGGNVWGTQIPRGEK